MAKIQHNLKECIGCGSCVAVCADFFELKGDKAHLKGGKKKGNIEELEVKDAKCVGEAIEICPVQCIKIIKE